MRLPGIMLAVAISAPAMAEQCVLQERSVTQHMVQIDERTPIRRDVVIMPGGGRKCVVDFRARVGATWHTAFGEHAWDGHRPSDEACAIAVDRAEMGVRERAGRSRSAAERVLVCRDRPELQELRTTTVGTVGDIGQFRPHPEHQARFWHNGAQCRWFVDSAFTGSAIRTFQGIVCEIGRDQWVVVDKF